MHVVVESPAKAMTVRTLLGAGYEVFATRGHVRDLPAKNGSVDPTRGFAMVYATSRRAASTLRSIVAALREAEALVLATDPDREAIAWQVLTWPEDNDALGGKPVRRVVFHEVTTEAVRAAMERSRAIDMGLVRAQQARRALDYLEGFHLSPVLWRQVRGGRSAGRVQSVALKLVCAREEEIEDFVPREYWTVEADVMAERGGRFTATLSGLDGGALERDIVRRNPVPSALSTPITRPISAASWCSWETRSERHRRCTRLGEWCAPEWARRRPFRRLPTQEMFVPPMEEGAMRGRSP